MYSCMYTRRVRLGTRTVQQIGSHQWWLKQGPPSSRHYVIHLPSCLLPKQQHQAKTFSRDCFPTQKRLKHKFIPRKAAVKLTDKARTFFRKLLDSPPRSDVVGILLSHQQSGTGEPRMVFTFKFVAESDIDRSLDEGVSLELVDETDSSTGQVVQVPKPPFESQNDTLPKLYVHHDAFLKVLGSTVDVDTDSLALILYDREGNIMDPNA